MAMQGLPHHLPGPLLALNPQFIAPKLDGQAAKIAIMNSMKTDDCEDLIEDNKMGLHWLSDYMQSDPNVPPSIPSLFIPVDAMQQMDRFTEMLALAYKSLSGYLIGFAMIILLTHPVVININAKHLQEGLNAHNYGMNEKWEADFLYCFNVPKIHPHHDPSSPGRQGWGCAAVVSP
ncbi:hypothetical protein PAXRUDRAFT_18978 [Paxillus rubicundulus Ve08.2h10]|uniref:Uncharacterized protein n=1 Tax=Paxillus rubicundulus Ve08.2h10 TaxID=930991 RepID=A0A0D0D5Z0_9AGAM|nr:hypothetical protein PAXRUDRAFT_18978 [Paxillus rubicundulus Ve08.2h10]